MLLLQTEQFWYEGRHEMPYEWKFPAKHAQRCNINFFSVVQHKKKCMKFTIPLCLKPVILNNVLEPQITQIMTKHKSCAVCVVSMRLNLFG